jgi:hypothetical protein
VWPLTAGAQGLQVTAGADFDFAGTGLVGVATKSTKDALPSSDGAWVPKAF